MAIDDVQVEHSAAVLTEGERSRAEHAALRLRAELLNLVCALPESARSALGMSRATGVSRTICHRLLSALQERDDNLRFLTLVPGVEGLCQCVGRLREQFPQLEEAVLAAADAAIAAFRDLIRQLSGSHSRLCARVRATQDAHAVAGPARWPSRQLALRREMYAVATALSERSMGARTSITIARPIPERPDEMEYVHVRAYLRHRVKPGALPWVAASAMMHTNCPDKSAALVGRYCALDGSPLIGRSGLPVIAEFSGQPLPIVTTRDGAGNMTHLIDPREDGTATDGYIPNLVLAYRVPSMGLHPARQTPPVHCEGISVQDAVERMVFDVYIHHSMAALATPSMNLYLGHRAVDCDLTDRWFDRLEGSPLLTLLGRGLGNAHTEAWERHAELTKYLFDLLGWSASDFVGYRCDEEYPLWGCDYVMAFEYGQPAQPAGS